jgi:hypothetical protein
LKGVTDQLKGSYWAILENTFELALYHNEIKALPLGKFADRGRLFWDKAEIRFRRDSSLPHHPYRLVVVADQLPKELPPLFKDTSSDLPDEEWDQPGDFERVLWGDPLDTKWFTSRIPRHLEYPGLSPKEGYVPVVQGVEYRRLGKLELYRFKELSNTPIQYRTEQ